MHAHGHASDHRYSTSTIGRHPPPPLLWVLPVPPEPVLQDGWSKSKKCHHRHIMVGGEGGLACDINIVVVHCWNTVFGLYPVKSRTDIEGKVPKNMPSDDLPQLAPVCMQHSVVVPPTGAARARTCPTPSPPAPSHYPPATCCVCAFIR